MSGWNPRVMQELRWKDAWNDEEEKISYRRRPRKILYFNVDWEWVATRSTRNWKSFRKFQWKVKDEKVCRWPDDNFDQPSSTS